MKKNILRYFILLISTAIIFYLLFVNIIDSQKQLSALNSLTSTIGIFIALIVTFLFGKLFSEREKRIERKKKIDEYSNKLSALRKICHFILKFNKLWKFNTVRETITEMYPELTIQEYLSMDASSQQKLLSEVQSDNFSVPGYLSIKGIVGETYPKYSVYDKHWRITYSLDQINFYDSCCLEAYCFISEHKGEFPEIQALPPPDILEIKKNFNIIFPKYNYDQFDYSKLQGLFGTFHSVFLNEHYYLTRLYSSKLPEYFYGILFDLIGLIIILILGMLGTIFDFNICVIKVICCGVFSIFIGIIIDMIYLIIKATRSELKIEDHY
jgi:hypothetical protein